MTLEQLVYMRGKRYELENKGHGGDRKSIRQNDGLKKNIKTISQKLAEQLSVMSTDRLVITNNKRFASRFAYILKFQRVNVPR